MKKKLLKLKSVKALLTLVAFMLLSFAVSSQTVTGVVTGADDNQPIPGVNIKVKGTDRGTITDLDGKFSVDVSSGDAVLIFSYVGYSTQEIIVGTQTTIDVLLAVGEDLEEVVVVGYGVKKKSLVTGAISSIDAEDLENSSASRVETALQGKTPGVFILPQSGSPGAGMNVRIRGTGTNGNGNPLYIVDGIRMTNINDISPSDIKSVEVLKDAASSAIYGAEGGNGVVIISTKKGSNRDGQINYNFSYGIQSVGKLPQLMNASQYAEFQNEAGRNVVTSSYDTDWLDAIFENAPITSHNLSFTGGNEKASYFNSISYFDQDGIIGGDKAKFKRFTVRSNVDYKIKKWLKIGTSINYARSSRSTLNEDSEFGGIISSALLIDPFTPTHYDANNLTSNMQALIDDGQPVRMDSDGRYFAISDNIQGEMINPLLQIDIAKGKNITDRVLGALSIEINPFEGLTITSRPGIDYNKSNFHSWTPMYYFSNERNNSSLSTIDNNNVFYQWQWENFATYQKSFGEGNLNVVLGMSAQESKSKFLNTNTSGMVREGDQYAEHNYTSSTEGIIFGNEFPNRLVSYFGRVSYDYKNKYMVQATLRNDLTSTTNVPKDGISGIFPSFSAGWTLSEEDFFPQGFVDVVKLRGSWGQNGSIQSITSLAQTRGQYLYTSTITTSGLRYPIDNSGSFVTAAEPGVLPNADLTWETSEQTNIGLDIKLWNSRISFSADYFIKKTKDLLMLGQPPAIAGTNPPMINAGDVENKGLELSIGLRNNEGDLKYGVNFNFATMKNEVTKLNVPTARLNGTGIGTGSWNGATAFEVGEPIWYFRGYETNGIDPNTGDPIFVDQNDDGVITDDDRVNLGDPHPDIMYGATLSLEYKGVDLSVNLQGQAGNQIVYGWMRTDRLSSNRHINFYENRWTPSNTNASMPAANADSRMYASDIMVADGDFLRVKQIQLGYNLPKNLLQAISISNARVYISLDDYFTFTKYEGMDVEAGSPNANSQGIDRGVYPTPRKVMFGLSVSF